MPNDTQPIAGKEIFSLANVSRGFRKGSDERQVLDGVNLQLHEGEIVGLLGRSGS